MLSGTGSSDISANKEVTVEEVWNVDVEASFGVFISKDLSILKSAYPAKEVREDYIQKCP